MADLDILPGLIVALAGAAAGAVVVISQHGRRGGDPAIEARRRDLEQKKDQALQALRDLDDLQGARGVQATQQERADLERQAAEALMALETEVPAAPPPTAAPPPVSAPATPAPAGGLSPQLQGFLTGAAVVGIAAAIAFGLKTGTTPRTEGMSITGGAPMGSAQPTPPPGAEGGAVAGVPPSLAPKPSAALDAARAKVAESPDSIDAWTSLGWILVESEGWIDVWNVAKRLDELQSGNPDGLTLQATVRLAMGMQDDAEKLLDEALKNDPNHVMALSWKGSVQLRNGDREGAKATWGRAAALAPDGGFERLISMADQAELPPRPTPHPGAGAPPAPAAPAVASGGNRVSGTVSLAPGATPPSGGVVFLIARRPGVRAGPPVASLKLPASRFPLSFELGDENVMMGGPFPAEVDLSARLDADGNAMTHDDGDLHADAGTVKAGVTGLALVLN